MTLRVVGAGFPRTGTASLRLALEQLLGGRCYHMHELFSNLHHVPAWRDALAGSSPDWDAFLRDYVAAVDWPASAFWRELSDANPEALVVLSVRDDPATWWQSVDQTILEVARREEYPEYGDWLTLLHELLRERIDERWDDAETAMAAYERSNDEVRETVPSDRLLVWRPEEGWGPICSALDLPVPREPFPRVNTSEEWARGAEAASSDPAQRRAKAPPVS